MDGRKIASLGASALVGTLLVSALVTPIHSQPLPGPVTVEGYRDLLTQIVPYGDLALSTREGRKLLVHRVGIAVGQVCPMSEIVGYDYDVAGCRDYAWAGARPQIRQAFEGARMGQALGMSIEVTSVGAR